MEKKAGPSASKGAPRARGNETNKRSQPQGQEWRRLRITGKAYPGENFTSAKPPYLSLPSPLPFQSEILCVNQGAKVVEMK